MDSDQLSTRQRVQDLEKKVEWLEVCLKSSHEELERVMDRCTEIERQSVSDFTRLSGVVQHVWRFDQWMTVGLTFTALGALGALAVALFMIFAR